MKFTLYLLRITVPEWVKLYMNFGLLKTYLSISYKVKQLLMMAKKTLSISDYKKVK